MSQLAKGMERAAVQPRYSPCAAPPRPRLGVCGMAPAFAGPGIGSRVVLRGPGGANDLPVGRIEGLLALLADCLGQDLVTTAHAQPPIQEAGDHPEHLEQQHHPAGDAEVEGHGEAQEGRRRGDENDQDVDQREEAVVGGVEPQQASASERHAAHDRHGEPNQDPEDVEEEVAKGNLHGFMREGSERGDQRRGRGADVRAERHGQHLLQRQDPDAAKGRQRARSH
mmetsp:Transcript_20500/g.58524  ORF Transcript_20500/g.58524 Transcript_20500/m.58524 type:complete len:225 (+) Transcript_20500:126-800(+)